VKTLRNLLFATLASFLLVFSPFPASAQETTDDPAEGVEAVLEKRAGDSESDRTSLLEFLKQENVEEIASNHGIDLEDLEGRLSTMSDQEISNLWSEIQALDDGLAGGDTITIASSTLIIILLIIILIQVA